MARGRSSWISRGWGMGLRIMPEARRWREWGRRRMHGPLQAFNRRLPASRPTEKKHNFSIFRAFTLRRNSSRQVEMALVAPRPTISGSAMVVDDPATLRHWLLFQLGVSGAA